jgi:hypothetical protein
MKKNSIYSSGFFLQMQAIVFYLDLLIDRVIGRDGSQHLCTTIEEARYDFCETRTCAQAQAA